MTNSAVVVDSNLAIFTVVDTEFSSIALRFWDMQVSSGSTLHVPGLWNYETTSVIRKYWATGKITEAEAREALRILDQLPIQFIPVDYQLRQAALSWAGRLHQKAAYDGFYLATAERLGVELWTADQALTNNAKQAGISWVRWMGELE